MLLNKKTVKMPGADPAFSQSSPYIRHFPFRAMAALAVGLEENTEFDMLKELSIPEKHFRQAVSSVLFEFIDDFIEP